MNVRNIMKKEVVKAKKDSSVQDAMDLMVDYDIGCLIIEEGGEYGIVTRKDVVNKVIAYEKDPFKVKVGDICTYPVLTVSPDMSVKEAARLMSKANVRRFPVVEKGILVGIVSNSDVFKSYA